MASLMRLVVAIRTIRATYEVEPRRRIEVTVVAPAEADAAFVGQHAGLVKALAVLDRLDVTARAADGPPVIRQPVGPMELRIPMAGMFDIAAEKTRLGKERLKIDAELEGLRKKLDNPQFVERARSEVVAQNRERVAELAERRRRVEEMLGMLGASAGA
jgi:valyl-tRNA synthetase